MADKFQSVIFDLDGTLVNAYRAVSRSIDYTMEKMNLPKVSAYRVKRTVGWGDSHLVRELVGQEKFSRAVKIYRAHHLKALKDGVRFLPGAQGLLTFLKKGNYRLAVATNRPSCFTKIILRRLGLRNIFDYVLCGDEVARGKPHPAMLLNILKKFSIKPRHALYVGDMIIDVQAGRRAGVRTVAVSTGSSTHDELKKYRPWRVVKRISMLREIFSSRKGKR